jgi:hypothetical protein
MKGTFEGTDLKCLLERTQMTIYNGSLAVRYDPTQSWAFFTGPHTNVVWNTKKIRSPIFPAQNAARIIRYARAKGENS